MRDVWGDPVAREGRTEEHWVSMSDLMAGLMMVFMLIAITYLRLIHVKQEEVKQIAYAHRNSHQRILNELREELPPDLLNRMHATIGDDLSVEFRANELSFARGAVQVSDALRATITEFFPLFFRVIDKHKDNIQEVRIEGHTSSEWGPGDAGPAESYFHNMELSQGRTREVLQLCYRLSTDSVQQEWVRKNFVAVGYSSAKIRLAAEGAEDSVASRRVTFKIVTNTETMIGKIIRKLDDGSAGGL